MATKVKRNRIQIATLLGNAWEQFGYEAGKLVSVDVQRSPEIGEDIIRPDLHYPNLAASVFITATASTQSFMRKRWRYINELFQLKQQFGPQHTVVNLIASHPSNLRSGGVATMKRLFDATIHAGERSEFDEIQKRLLTSIQKGASVEAALNTARQLPEYDLLQGWVANQLQISVRRSPSGLQTLWEVVNATNPPRSSPNPAVVDLPTYFRRACLKLLPLSPVLRLEVLRSARGSLVMSLPKPLLMRCGIEHRPSLGGRLRVSDHELVKTISNGFTDEELLETCAALSDMAEAKGIPIDELSNTDVVLARLNRLSRCVDSLETYAAFCAEQFEDSATTRVWAMEYAIALQRSSMLQANKEYVRLHGKLGVTNPIDNIVLKTQIGKSILSNQDKSVVFGRIAELLVDGVIGLDASDPSPILEYRLRSLKLQPYLNPPHVYFRTKMDSLGFHVEKGTADCLLNDIGIKGRGSRVEELFFCRRGDERFICKVLSGYRGGYEHKADEMAARGWLLRYRRDGAGFSASTVRLLFIYEGEWTPEYLSMLRRAGWDESVRLSDLVQVFGGA